MYNVLIADDEFFVRTSIISRVDWAGLGLNVVGEAENGLEALGFIRSGSVDILLTDIRMPEMDGLTLISAAKELNGAIQCIILSGYDDFAYAKSAILLGVANYIQKPVDEEELENTLRQVVQRLDSTKQIQQMHSQSQSVLKRMSTLKVQQGLNQLFLGREALEEFVESGEQFAVILVYTSALCSPDRFNIWVEERSQLQPGADSQLLGSPMDAMPLRLRFLMHGHQLTCGAVCAAAQQLMDDLQAQLPNDTVRAAYSEVVLGAGRIPSANAQAVTALKSKLLYPHALLSPKLIQPQNLDEQQQAIERVMQLRDALASRDMKQARLLIYSLFSLNLSHIHTLETALRYIGDVIQEYRARYLLDASELSTLLSSEDCVLHYDTLEQLRNELIPQILDFFFYNESFLDDRIVGHVQYYIRQNLAEDLKVSTLGKLFYLSPNYLSYLFKKETGYTLSEYVENVRMERARALLSMSVSTVSEVAAQVGYPDAAYFSRVFKKATGHSPQKYQAEFRLDQGADRRRS